MKKTDLYRRKATIPEQMAMHSVEGVGGATAATVIATMLTFTVVAGYHAIARTMTGNVADFASILAQASVLSLAPTAFVLYVLRGIVSAPTSLVDAVEQAEDDATSAVPDDIRRQVAALRPAAQAAARQLNAAEKAEETFRATHRRAFARDYNYSNALSNPELYDAIAPEREALEKVKEDATDRIHLICEEADTLARVCRKYNAAVGTPSYDFLIQARKAAAAAPSMDALRERSRAAKHELEVSSALDDLPLAASA